MSTTLSLFVVLSLAIFSGSAQAGRFFGNSRPVRSFTSRDRGDQIQNAAIRFNSISASPHPIAMPGSIRLAINIDVLRNISGDGMSVEITISRKFDFGWFGHRWIDLTSLSPGQNRIDICAFISNIVRTQGCPAEVTGNGFTCACPPRPGSYVTRNDLPFVINIRERDLPHRMFHDLITGTYKLHSTVFDGHGAVIGRFEVEFGLEHIP